MQPLQQLYTCNHGLMYRVIFLTNTHVQVSIFFNLQSSLKKDLEDTDGGERSGKWKPLLDDERSKPALQLTKVGKKLI